MRVGLAHIGLRTTNYITKKPSNYESNLCTEGSVGTRNKEKHFHNADSVQDKDKTREACLIISMEYIDRLLR